MSQWINSTGDTTAIFQANLFNIMPADDLIPYISKSSSAMVLTMLDQ